MANVKGASKNSGLLYTVLSTPLSKTNTPTGNLFYRNSFCTNSRFCRILTVEVGSANQQFASSHVPHNHVSWCLQHRAAETSGVVTVVYLMRANCDLLPVSRLQLKQRQQKIYNRWKHDCTLFCYIRIERESVKWKKFTQHWVYWFVLMKTVIINP